MLKMNCVRKWIILLASILSSSAIIKIVTVSFCNYFIVGTTCATFLQTIYITFFNHYFLSMDTVCMIIVTFKYFGCTVMCQ